MKLSEIVRKASSERKGGLSIKGYLKGVQSALSKWKDKDISEAEKKAVDKIQDTVLDTLKDID